MIVRKPSSVSSLDLKSFASSMGGISSFGGSSFGCWASCFTCLTIFDSLGMSDFSLACYILAFVAPQPIGSSEVLYREVRWEVIK